MKTQFFLTLVVAALGGFLQQAGARAQTQNPTLVPAGQSIARGQLIRVAVNFRIEIDGEGGDLTATEKARKTLYDQAARECALLIGSFPGRSCTVESLNIMVQRDNPTNRGSSFLMGAANYQLRAD